MRGFLFNTITMTRILQVTPAMAKKWLEGNTMNRRLDKNRVRDFSNLMAAGKFYLNGDTIRFADDGTLLDGQHRLAAVVFAGITVTMEIREGLSKYVMPTIDVGTKRSSADILKMLGRSETAKLAGAINWAHFFMNADGLSQPQTLHRASTMSALEQEEFINDNPSILDCVRSGGRWYDKFRPLVPTMLMGFYFAAKSIDPDGAYEFCSGLATGANMDEHDPRMSLRRRLLMRQGANKREPMSTIAVLHIYAWNAYRQGRTMKRVIYTPGDATPRMM